MPPALNLRAYGTNGASPLAEPLHPRLPNATEKSAYPLALAGNKSPAVFISFTRAGRSLKVIPWLLKLSISLPFFQDRVTLGHFHFWRNIAQTNKLA